MSGLRSARRTRRSGSAPPSFVTSRSFKRWMSSASGIAVGRGVLGPGQDLEAAAEVIANRARELASGWSQTIPDAIKVEVNGKWAVISCDAPPAYPNEIKGVRHPVFARSPYRGDWTWVTNQYRPFLAPAADEKAGAAMMRYLKRVDRLLEKAGFK